jgi:hypothetical protein
MQTRLMLPVVAALSGGIVLLGAAPAFAHEGRSLGDLEMEVGFGTEPAYAGEVNSVQLLLVHDGNPVVDLGDTLEVEVTFGDQTQQFPIAPFFEPGEFGTPGDYRAWFIPTRSGQYTFHFFGTIDGEKVDETFTSGPKTFSDVESPQSVQFPEQDPSAGELADRIDRVEPRLTDAIAEARTEAVGRAEAATDDASTARTLGLIGLVVGAIGLLVAVAALLAARRQRA